MKLPIKRRIRLTPNNIDIPHYRTPEQLTIAVQEYFNYTVTDQDGNPRSDRKGIRYMLWARTISGEIDRVLIECEETLFKEFISNYKYETA